MQEIITLLQQIKSFLLKYIELNESEKLLQKVEIQLANMAYPLSASKDLSSQNYYSSSPTKIPTKFSLLDMFVLEHSFEHSEYQIIPFNQNQNSPFKNDRSALCNLILGKIKYHLKSVEKTQSMTQLHQLTSNIPQCKPVLIMPNYTTENCQISQQTNRYYYIYEESVCMEYKEQYYLVDRYYIYCTNGLGYNTISMIHRQIRQRIFSERILLGETSENVNNQLVHQCLTRSLPVLYEDILRRNLKVYRGDLKQSFPIFQISEKQVKYKTSFFSVSKLCYLAVLIFFIALTDRKIVLLITKDKKNLLSDVILSLQKSLGQIKYVYPVVFASLTKQHMEYLQSPVPLLIGLWGTQKQILNFQKIRQDLGNSDNSIEQQKSENNIKQILIDLEKMSIPGSLNFSSEEVYSLEKLNQYIQKEGKGLRIQQKLNNFMRQFLLSESEQRKNQWIQILRKKIKQCQYFHVYNQKYKN